MGLQLYHVLLSVECVEIATARRPVGPDISSLATVEAWAKEVHIADVQRDLLLQRYLLPALDSLLSSPELPEMLKRCEESAAAHAVIRLGLELP